MSSVQEPQVLQSAIKLVHIQNGGKQILFAFSQIQYWIGKKVLTGNL